MNFLFAYKMAIKSIWGNKTRSALTMLGVIIGVMAVIVAVGFAQGSMQTVTDKIEGMGSNLITTMILSTSESKQVTLKDLEKLEASTQYISKISPYILKQSDAKFEANTKSTRIFGTDENYLSMQGMKLESGRFISRDDVENNEKVAVVGATIKNKLYDEENPVGKHIKINGTKFLVIGCVESVANGMEGTNDDMVMLPISVAQRTLKITNVTMFLTEASNGDVVDIAVQKVKDFLYDVYKDDDQYIVVTQEAILSVMGDISGIMMLILGSIATISLVVGGIGIMNIMLVSVSERTREIGIRKAIGAKRRDIMVQFLIESLLLTGLGGIIGIILGLLIIKYIIGNIGLIQPVYSLPWTIAAFSISLTIGITFGLFPAYKAAKLNPIEALRNE